MVHSQSINKHELHHDRHRVSNETQAGTHDFSRNKIMAIILHGYGEWWAILKDFSNDEEENQLTLRERIEEGSHEFKTVSH